MILVLLVSMAVSSESIRSLLENVFAEASTLLAEHSELATSAIVALVAIILTTKLISSNVPGPVKSVQVPEDPLEAKDDAEEGRFDPKMPLRVPGREGFIQCYNPATSRFLGEVQAMDRDHVFTLVDKARNAQQEWSKTSFGERRRVLAMLRRCILENQDTIVRVACRDSGKPKVDAMLGEVLVVCDKIDYLIKHGEQAIAREYRPTGLMSIHKYAWVEYLPLGVIGAIAPWNYPFQNFMTHILSGLFAGNALVAKVSEHTSWSSGYYGRLVASVLESAGHSPDLVQTITGFAESGEALIDAVDKVIFTGSPHVGRLVMERASKTWTPVTLELGGKDVCILCEDAKLSSTIPTVLRGVYQNCGQNCIGIERVFVYDKIYDKFVAEVTDAVRQIRQGNPLGKDFVDAGAMAMPAQIDIIQELVVDAVSKGARLLVGGKRNPDLPNGYFYLPTILADVNKSMRIANEEVFGPVMSIFKVRNDEEAIELANSTHYGLGSSVLCENRQRQEKFNRSLRCGMTALNDFATYYMVQSLPFGGVKHSGFGRFAGTEGLRDLCLQKSVVQDRIPFIRTEIPPLLQYPVKSVGPNFLNGLVSFIYDPNLVGKAKGVVKLLKGLLGQQ